MTVKRLPILPKSVRTSVRMPPMSVVTVSGMQGRNLNANVQVVQHVRFPKAFQTVLKMVVLQTKPFMLVVGAMIKVPRPPVNRGIVTLFAHVFLSFPVTLSLIDSDLVVFAPAFAELSLGRSDATDLGGKIIKQKIY